MNTKELYKLNEQKQQERLNDLAENGGDVSDISREIVLARCLLEGSLNAGNVGLSQQLLLTIDRLCKSHEQAQFRRHELLEKSVVLRLVGSIVDSFMRAFGDVPGAEDRIDRVSQELVGTIEAAKNNREIL